MTRHTEPKNKYNVTYDLISKRDGVSHKQETINAASTKNVVTYLRIKTRKLGYVRNICDDLIS